MACDLFNSEHKGMCSSFSPRISFSSDFVDAEKCTMKREHGASQPPSDPDFEFSVSSNTMLPADELFFKGKLLPFKEDCTKPLQKMTLREELSLLDDEDDEADESSSKGSSRWKELLGLKKNHIAPSKLNKNIGFLESVQGRISTLPHQQQPPFPSC